MAISVLAGYFAILLWDKCSSHKWQNDSQNQFSFFIKLIYNDREKNCGASLIDWEHLLTTAWCFIESTDSNSNMETTIANIQNQNIAVCSDTMMRLGHNPVVNSIKNVYIHPDYQCLPEMLGMRCMTYYENDIAVVSLQHTMLGWSPVITPIRLPSLHYLPNNNMHICEHGLLVTGVTSDPSPENNFTASLTYVHYLNVDFMDTMSIDNSKWHTRTDKMFYTEVLGTADHAKNGDQGSPFLCYKRFCNNDTPFQFGILTRIRKVRKKGLVLSTFEPIMRHIRFIAEYVPLKNYIMNVCESCSTKLDAFISLCFTSLLYYTLKLLL